MALSALVHAAALFWAYTQRAAPTLVYAPLEVEIASPVPEPVAPRPPEPPRPVPPQVKKPQRSERTEVRREEVPLAQADAPTSDAPRIVTDAPFRDSSPGGITLVPSAPATPEAISDEASRPSAQAQASRLVKELALEHRRARRPPNEYFGTMRQLLEEMWRVEQLIAARQSPLPEGDRAQVRLTQGPDGALLDVALVTPPRSPELGRSLVGDLQAGAAVLPRPPPEVMQGKPQLSSVWEFLLKPAPQLIKLSVNFDITSLVDKKAIPKFSRKRVEFLLQDE